MTCESKVETRQFGRTHVDDGKLEDELPDRDCWSSHQIAHDSNFSNVIIVSKVEKNSQDDVSDIQRIEKIYSWGWKSRLDESSPSFLWWHLATRRALPKAQRKIKILDKRPCLFNQNVLARQIRIVRQSWWWI